MLAHAVAGSFYLPWNSHGRSAEWPFKLRMHHHESPAFSRNHVQLQTMELTHKSLWRCYKLRTNIHSMAVIQFKTQIFAQP